MHQKKAGQYQARDNKLSCFNVSWRKKKKIENKSAKTRRKKKKQQCKINNTQSRIERMRSIESTVI